MLLVRDIEIELTSDQLSEVDQWARQRHSLTKSRGKQDRYGLKNSDVSVHRDGLAAEYAVALALDLLDVWTPVVDEYEQLTADVGPILNVRGTSHGRGRLILHPKDDDAQPYVLVTYPRPPVYRLVGWIWGSDGKIPQWWTDPGTGRPAYFIPQDHLLDINILSENRDALR